MNHSGLVPLIQVFDMPRALGFYRDGLGFEVEMASPEVETPEGRFSHWMMLKSGHARLMLNTAYDSGERPPEEDRARAAAHGDIILYIGCDNVDAVHSELKAKGLSPEEPHDAPYGMRQMSLIDPDGYRIVFQHWAH